MKITELPYDVLSLIITTAIISDINYFNYKITPSIIDSHIVFRKTLSYLNDNQWKDICKTVINIPDKLIINDWHNTFLTLPNNINLQLSAFAIEGNFGRIRRIEDKLREKYSTSFIPTFVIDNIFECKEESNLLQILREVLKYRIEPKISSYIKTTYSSVNTGFHIIREYNNYIHTFE